MPEKPDPTLIWRKNLKQVYHIDYCFVSDVCLSHVKNTFIGNIEKLIKYSDHAPLIIEFNLKGAAE
jgi:exonuclease III